jgi:hypothetical protein
MRWLNSFGGIVDSWFFLKESCSRASKSLSASSGSCCIKLSCSWRRFSEYRPISGTFNLIMQLGRWLIVETNKYSVMYEFFCYVMLASLGIWFSAFWNSVVLSSSRVLRSTKLFSWALVPLKLSPQCCIRTLGINYSVMQCCIRTDTSTTFLQKPNINTL